jgi:hypothetical protein
VCRTGKYGRDVKKAELVSYNNTSHTFRADRCKNAPALGLVPFNMSQLNFGKLDGHNTKIFVFERFDRDTNEICSELNYASR